jgi:acyl carrier protein
MLFYSKNNNKHAKSAIIYFLPGLARRRYRGQVYCALTAILEHYMYLEEVKTILIDVLALGPAGQSLDQHSALLGSLPELDSMAVVQLIGALEEQFGFSIDDDEISATTFATLGSLAAFVQHKLTA